MLLPLSLYASVLVFSLFILHRSSELLVSAITRLGRLMRLSQFITGFVLLGFATSSPELFIGINSALSGTPQLSLGNLLGANIVLLSLVVGAVAVYTGQVSIRKDLSNLERLLQIISLIIAPLVLVVDGRLSRLDGVFLLLLYCGYIYYLYRTRPTTSPPLTEELVHHRFYHVLFLTVAGLLGVVLSSKAIVLTSLKAATLLSISPVAIGILILSLGTNLPEISVAISAIRRHHSSLVIGDCLGSAATNTFIVALLSLISPFSLSGMENFGITAIFMLLVVSAFFLFTRTKNSINSQEGMVLLTLYLTFILTEAGSLLLKN